MRDTWKWYIVVKQDNVYKFAPCFAAYRETAKCLITLLRPDDPKLKKILSKIWIYTRTYIYTCAHVHMYFIFPSLSS